MVVIHSSAVIISDTRASAPERTADISEDGKTTRSCKISIPAIHEVVRWRLADLAHWIREEFGISLSETTVGREVKALGFSKISARPQHYAQNELAIDAFKKTVGRTGRDPREAPARHRDRAVVAR